VVNSTTCGPANMLIEERLRPASDWPRRLVQWKVSERLVDTSAPKSSLCRCETALIMLAAFSAITRVGASVWPVVTRGITVPVLPFGASLPCSNALIEAANSSVDTPKLVIVRNNTATGHGAGHSPAEYRRIILTEMPRTRAAENLLKFAMDRAGTAHRWRHCRPGLMR